jgi:hypothetical protein
MAAFAVNHYAYKECLMKKLFVCAIAALLMAGAAWAQSGTHGTQSNPYDWSTTAAQLDNADIPAGSYIKTASGSVRRVTAGEIDWAKKEAAKRKGGSAAATTPARGGDGTLEGVVWLETDGQDDAVLVFIGNRVFCVDGTGNNEDAAYRLLDLFTSNRANDLLDVDEFPNGAYSFANGKGSLTLEYRKEVHS